MYCVSIYYNYYTYTDFSEIIFVLNTYEYKTIFYYYYYINVVKPLLLELGHIRIAISRDISLVCLLISGVRLERGHCIISI